ncbi:DUF6456 domain-containing protein [Nitratireductor luteus]|uniref:DUF6456 domain-containing protein n=1 Tax=Nitratireductor luteus TaxID=2976980 RepID=UPI0022406E1D|nr:DUF6456 domain-containing protein [Nitratireductor luteus]
MKRGDADLARGAREGTRLIRFLAKGTARLEGAACTGRMLIDGGDRGTVSARPDVIVELAREGVILRQGNRIALTADGMARARRADAAADPFAAQHRTVGTVRTEVAGHWTEATVNLRESPLARLARQRGRAGETFLGEREFRAGERLRADYTRGQIMPRLGANWSEAVAGGRRGSHENGIGELTDAALSARQRVEKALEAVGPELSGVLVDICCFLKGLEQVEAERGWPVRSAKIVLKTALGALARHYEPQHTSQRRSVLHWGAADFRPSIKR